MMADDEYLSRLETALNAPTRLAAAERILLFPELHRRCHDTVARDKAFNDARAEIRHNVNRVKGAVWELKHMTHDYGLGDHLMKKLTDSAHDLLVSIAKLEGYLK